MKYRNLAVGVTIAAIVVCVIDLLTHLQVTLNVTFDSPLFHVK